jgi:hypothetical protein
MAVQPNKQSGVPQDEGGALGGPGLAAGGAGALAGLTVTLNCLVALAELLSVTCTVKVDEPAAVGVPLSVPPVESVSPAGGDPEVTDQVYGATPPEAASCCE